MTTALHVAMQGDVWVDGWFKLCTLITQCATMVCSLARHQSQIRLGPGEAAQTSLHPHTLQQHDHGIYSKLDD